MHNLMPLHKKAAEAIQSLRDASTAYLITLSFPDSTSQAPVGRIDHLCE